MADAISRDVVKNRIHRLKTRMQRKKPNEFQLGQLDGLEYALSIITACDALEVVAVTRCKECRHATERHTTLPYCLIQNRRKDPDDYCMLSGPDEE